MIEKNEARKVFALLVCGEFKQRLIAWKKDKFTHSAIIEKHWIWDNYIEMKIQVRSWGN